MGGMLVNPYSYGIAGGGPGTPPGGGDIVIVASLAAPTSSKWTFAALDLSPYDWIEIWAVGVVASISDTIVRLVLKVGAGPTVGTHNVAGYSLSSSATDDLQVNTGTASAALVTSASGAFNLGNTAGDAWNGIITIDQPGDAGVKKTAAVRSQHGYSGSDNVGNNQTAIIITNTDPITEIVLEANKALTAGKVIILGHEKGS